MVVTPEQAAGSLGQHDGGRPPTILFVNDLWGYGTVTMALAVAEELEGRAVRRFAGFGPGFELARRACFERLLHVNTMSESIDPGLEQCLEEADGVVSVMNRRVAARAAELGKPCVYLDCLLWMWATAPAVPAGVPYYAERFPGTDERLRQWGDRFDEAKVVGPLISRPTKGANEDADDVLINFGGLYCPLVDQRALTVYADVMAQCALRALADSPGRVIIGAGQHMLDRMDASTLRSIRPGVELTDLAPGGYLAELRRSRALISASGMHALYEACALGVPCICLPAQNLSGSLALDVLRQEDVEHPVNWSHLYGLQGLDPADQPAACNRIADCIHEFAVDDAAQTTLVGHLRAALEADHLALVRERQASFFASQGGFGAGRVAERLLELIGVPVGIG